MSYFILLKTFKTLIWYYTMSNKFSFAVNKLSIITWPVACFLYFCLHFLHKKRNPVMFILLYSNIRLFILCIYDIHVHSLLHVFVCLCINIWQYQLRRWNIEKEKTSEYFKKFQIKIYIKLPLDLNKPHFIWYKVS